MILDTLEAILRAAWLTSRRVRRWARLTWARVRWELHRVDREPWH